jgi:hypothetical protein
MAMPLAGNENPLETNNQTKPHVAPYSYFNFMRLLFYFLRVDRNAENKEGLCCLCEMLKK